MKKRAMLKESSRANVCRARPPCRTPGFGRPQACPTKGGIGTIPPPAARRPPLRSVRLPGQKLRRENARDLLLAQEFLLAQELRDGRATLRRLFRDLRRTRVADQRVERRGKRG